jgi:hypothetical protein
LLDVYLHYHEEKNYIYEHVEWYWSHLVPYFIVSYTFKVVVSLVLGHSLQKLASCLGSDVNQNLGISRCFMSLIFACSCNLNILDFYIHEYIVVEILCWLYKFYQMLLSSSLAVYTLPMNGEWISW